jgi:Peptidase propeptide and YPEB domain
MFDAASAFSEEGMTDARSDVAGGCLAGRFVPGTGLERPAGYRRERMKLVAALAAEGCSGGEMEFDDGLYEVEDATCRDGKEYDLIFDANFKLLSKKLDDD